MVLVRVSGSDIAGHATITGDLHPNSAGSDGAGSTVAFRHQGIRASTQARHSEMGTVPLGPLTFTNSGGKLEAISRFPHSSPMVSPGLWLDENERGRAIWPSGLGLLVNVHNDRRR